MDALLVVDMQVGMLDGPPKFDLQGLVGRINQLAVMVRRRSGMVVWVQHCRTPSDSFAPASPGWQLLPELDRQQVDMVVPKSLNDPFAGTNLTATLQQAGVVRLFVTGWATDFCVDSAVRSAVSCGYHVIAVSDGHTASDRPHLDALTVIRHHNWLWANLIPSRSIRVAGTAELLAGDN